MKLCINCGKINNPETLFCDACGTDYNVKPKCEHLYTEWRYADDPIKQCVRLLLKCGKCDEVITLTCSENMMNSLSEYSNNRFRR